MLATLPYTEVSVGRVAAEAGVSRQAVYLHFGSKANLLLALVAWMDEAGRLPSLIAKALSESDPVERLLESMRGRRSTTLTSPTSDSRSARRAGSTPPQRKHGTTGWPHGSWATPPC